MALGPDGAVYVTDYGTRRLVRFNLPTPQPTATGGATPEATGNSVEFLWSANGSAADRLDNPLFVRLSPDGKLWVCDISNRFFIFDLDGNLQEVWGAPGSGPGQFRFQDPSFETCSITFAPDGSFYVVDSLNHRVQRFDRDHTFLGEWGRHGSGDGQFLLPYALAIARDGNVLVTDILRGDIQRFDPNGTFLGAFDGSTGPDGTLTGPGSIAIDAAGRVYVGESDANRVRVFDLDGTQIGVLGEGGPDFGGFNGPVDIAIDEQGYAHVADAFNNRILVFNPNGHFEFEWGEFGSGDGQFNNPGSIALNRGGTAYVVDWRGDRIEKFKITGPFPPPATPTP